jgi:hypothetical protein
MAYYSNRKLKINGKVFPANSRLPKEIQNIGTMVQRGDIRVVAEPVEAQQPSKTESTLLEALPESLPEELPFVEIRKKKKHNG